MEELIERAVERVIAYMYDNLGEQITIDDMARRAMFSKFYFTRFFQRVTGLSPGRFLSAIRLQHAKELLLSTGLTVTEVSYRVGYNSIGTFSSRFRESVGLSPTAYRQQRGFIDLLPGQVGTGEPDSRAATVRGQVWPPRDAEVGPTFVGLFPSRLPHGRPARCILLPEPGMYLLDGVPPGTWYLYAGAHTAGDLDRVQSDSHVAVHGPITVVLDTDIRLPDLWLRPSSVFDPPVLLAWFDLRAVAARRAARASAQADGKTAKFVA
jgi:AraC family transcriptional regulator